MSLQDGEVGFGYVSQRDTHPSLYVDFANCILQNFFSPSIFLNAICVYMYAYIPNALCLCQSTGYSPLTVCRLHQLYLAKLFLASFIPECYVGLHSKFSFNYISSISLSILKENTMSEYGCYRMKAFSSQRQFHW